MIRTIATLLVVGVVGAGGWLAGSAYPAPPEWVDRFSTGANTLRAQLRLRDVDMQGLRGLVSQQKFDQLSSEIQGVAAAAGEIIVVEKDTGTLEEQLDNLALSEEQAVPVASTPAPAAAGGAAPGAFNAALDLCPRMTVQNAPASNAEGHVTAYKAVVNIEGVRIATGPIRDACLSSGFGTRSSRLHKGVDYHSETGGPVLAGGEGTIVEMKYRDDYGNMILIDHGGGVYTRYAHLASFGAGLSPGVKVRAGEQIGLMGNTGAYRVPVHLHYEVLLGDYANPKASFGLTPANPFTYPSAT